MLYSPRKKSNKIGRMANITDLPYPVGKETKVSLPDTKLCMASICFGFNSRRPMCPTAFFSAA